MGCPGAMQWVAELASAVEVAVVADDGAGAPVEAAAKLVPDARGVLVRRAAVIEHAVPQHFQPRALELRHAPAPAPQPRRSVSCHQYCSSSRC